MALSHGKVAVVLEGGYFVPTVAEGLAMWELSFVLRHLQAEVSNVWIRTALLAIPCQVHVLVAQPRRLIVRTVSILL